MNKTSFKGRNNMSFMVTFCLLAAISIFLLQGCFCPEMATSAACKDCNYNKNKPVYTGKNQPTRQPEPEVLLR